MRDAVLHNGLLLVRTSDAEALDALLARAAVRKALVRRLAPDTALFQRSGLKEVLARLQQTDTPVAFEDLTSPGLAS